MRCQHSSQRSVIATPHQCSNLRVLLSQYENIGNLPLRFQREIGKTRHRPICNQPLRQLSIGHLQALSSTNPPYVMDGFDRGQLLFKSLRTSECRGVMKDSSNHATGNGICLSPSGVIDALAAHSNATRSAHAAPA